MEIKILNLTKPSQGSVPFHINPFPDGQRSITLTRPDELYKKTHTVIVQSISVFQDWELLLSAVSALRAHTREYSVYIPYLLGARSDRKFETGGDFYHNDINEGMLKWLNCPVVVADLHCDSNLIKTFHPWEFWDDKWKCMPSPVQSSRIFPDVSAALRAHNYGIYSTQEIIMKKERQGNKIIQTPITEDCKFILSHNNVHLILDDLFDGGRSFLGLVKSLGKQEAVYIFVSHFIGSDLDILKELQDLNVKIITTNSYAFSDEADSYLKVVLDVFNPEYVKRVVEKHVLQTGTPSSPF